jgi:hypothetical protein
MIFPDGSAGADHREDEEQQSRDFQPEHMQHTAYAAERDTTCPVKGSYPTILASLAARNPQKRPALSTEIVGCHAFYLSLCAAAYTHPLFYQRISTTRLPIGGHLRPEITKLGPHSPHPNVLS